MKNSIRFGLAVVGLTIALAALASAATFTVTTTLDAGPGSLRDAIVLANGNPGPDLIDFNIAPGGLQTIVPLAPLPPLTDMSGVTIDGLTQPGGTNCGPNPSTTNLLIEIRGSAVVLTPGLWVISDNNVIRGLVINDFEQDGVLIEGGVGNPSANNNIVHCCFIGTDPAGGVDIGNGRNMATLYGGVRIKNVAGGVALNNIVDACLISGNFADGATIWGPIQPGDVGFNTVLNCYIGTDKAGGIDLGNDHTGVNMSEGTHDNMVQNNMISGNDYDGVGIEGFNNVGFGPPILSFNNHVENNVIGLDASLNPLPNTMNGVAIGTYGPGFWGCAVDNFIGPGNTIAYNGRNGVYVWEDAVDAFNADQNIITTNSIYENAALGIDLHTPGVTPNDPGDPDRLANEEMNFPVIDSALEASCTTMVYGTLDTPSPNTATVEVFKARLDPSGHGEGEVFLGSTNPDAVGNWSLAIYGLSVGDSLTATATDLANNTSEFSLNNVVVKGATCCNTDGIRGDADNDCTFGCVTVSDLSFLVAFLFQNGPAPTCIDEANVDGICGTGGPIDVADLSYLVSFLFLAGPAPGPC